MSKKIKYKRKLTEDEQEYINDLSGRSPRLAMNLAKTLREQSFRKGGRTHFFDVPKDEDEKRKKKPIKKRKRIRTPKWPLCKGKIYGFGILKDEE